MANRVQKFQRWLYDKRRFRVDWFAKDPQQQLVPEEALANMPEALAEELVSAANDLPIPERAEEKIISSIEATISQWQKDPLASPNSIVVLADPVASVSKILADTLTEMPITQEENPPDIHLLNWVERPVHLDKIKQQIKDKLNLSDDDEGKSANNPDRQSLMVIPNLCWCFLRSADGLDGLDYLQDLLPRDRAQFWMMGSGIVGWEYLKSTLKFHAYCGEVVKMPCLSGEDLQNWLEPLVEQFDISFPDAALHKRLQNPDELLEFDISVDKPVEAIAEISQEVSATVQYSVQAIKDEVLPGDDADHESSPERNYFERLASVSDGVSEIALQLFIKSLRYRRLKPDTEDTAQETEVSPDQADEDSEEDHHLVAGIPKLPPLPELDQDDLYLLYSLLLHGDMTIDALFRSLGDAPNVVNNQVQILRNQGVVEQKGTVLKINPVHYPNLRRELSRNNFIIEVP